MQAIFAPERFCHHTSHVASGHERANATGVERQIEAVLICGVQDFVFGPEPREDRHAGQRQVPNEESLVGNGHVLLQPTHSFHLKAVMRTRVRNRARRLEQQRLEESVRNEVEDRANPGANGEAHDHVAELRDR